MLIFAVQDVFVLHVFGAYVRQVSEGTEYAQKVIDMERHALTARAYLMLGIGYSIMSDEVRLQKERQSYQMKAVEAFRK